MLPQNVIHITLVVCPIGIIYLFGGGGDFNHNCVCLCKCMRSSMHRWLCVSEWIMWHWLICQVNITFLWFLGSFLTQNDKLVIKFCDCLIKTDHFNKVFWSRKALKKSQISSLTVLPSLPNKVKNAVLVNKLNQTQLNKLFWIFIFLSRYFS